jgi:hypothetical protein
MPQSTSRDVIHSRDPEVFVRRRIWFALTSVTAASLAIGVGMAGAASRNAANNSTVKATTLHCKVSLTTEPPPGSNSVNQPASQGSQYGPIHCSPSALGPGIEADSFTVPDSGDTVGTYTQYFKAGTIRGSFDLTPQESGPVSSTSFSSQAWEGTLTVTGGTGIYQGIRRLSGRKHIGTLSCSSSDSVHLACIEKVRVTMPPTA